MDDFWVKVTDIYSKRLQMRLISIKRVDCTDIWV